MEQPATERVTGKCKFCGAALYANVRKYLPSACATCPSPEYIAAEMEAIRSGWSEPEKRAVCPVPPVQVHLARSHAPGEFRGPLMED